MLNRTPSSFQTKVEPEQSDGGAPTPEGGRARRLLRGAWQFFVRQSYSSLTRRIIFLNLTGLLALVVGIL